jgi:Fe-S cluster assembly iron-binding protein IscA
MALEEPKENEKTVIVNGIDLLIWDEIKPYTDKSTIDYIDDPEKSGFTIRLEGKCSC